MKKTAILVIAIGLIGVYADTAMAAHSTSCAQCHVPHNAGDPAALAIPLWNPASFSAAPTAGWTLYSSKKFDVLPTNISQPDGASKVCLGCHDGSYSVFQNPLANQKNIIRPDDLGRSHPVSFQYTSALASAVKDGSLRDPSADSGLGTGRSIKADLLDENDKMQCTSCHDVHMTGYGTYHLRWNNYVVGSTDGNMCRVCHQK